jgi:PAS domain S-box-containing protein
MAISKYRSQLYATSAQATLHLGQAQNALATRGRIVAERLQQALRARTNDLLASSQNAVVLASGKIAKCRTQLFATSEQATLRVRQAQNRLTTSVGKLQLALRARKNDVQNLLANSRDAIAATHGNFAKYRWQLLATSEQVALRLRQAQNRLTTSVGQKLHLVLCARKNDVQTFLANSRDAVAATHGKFAKYRTQFFATSEQVTRHLGQAQTTLTRLGRRVVDKPRRLRKALRRRKTDLRKLLANPLDAVVVTDVDRRFVAANPKALDLFGVSETNLRNFTIDAFLPRGQILYFEGNGSPFIGRAERHGECKIRRLDGSLRAAEYSFVANFAPRQHLCRFRNVKTTQVKFIPTFNYGRGNDSNSGRLH